MKKYIEYIISLLTLCSLMAATVHAEKYPHDIYIANHSFDEYAASWALGGEGTYTSETTAWGHNGDDDVSLKLWIPTSSDKAFAKKTLYGLAPGKYKLSAYFYGGGEGSYMYATTGDKTEKTSAAHKEAWLEQTLTIDVTDENSLEIGFVCENVTNAWCDFDDVTLTCVEQYAVSNRFISNNSFENGTEGFEVKNAQINENGRTGNCLSVPRGAEASVSIENLENGFYEVSLYCRSDNANSVVTAASDLHTACARIPVCSDWKRTVLTDAYVANGKLEICVLSDSDLYIDDISLKKVDKYRNFITGGDITELSYLEGNNAIYRDADKVEGDCVKILADSGVNMARVRVYNQTGKETAIDVGNGKFYLPEGYQDAEDALGLCKRAKENGMQIEFTFHYSDFWTNAERQEIPLEWKKLIEGKSDKEAVDILEQCVYDYTLDIMTRLEEQGTVPELVSVGNETQFGMLYPYGYIGEDSDNWANLARFFNAGYRAVKEVSPSTQVILHLDDCGNFSKYEEFFGQCKAHKVNYDIIGSSYYPFWSQKTIEHAVEFCNSITERFDKNIIIMETGYNFYPYKTPDHECPGQLENNGPYEEIYPSTPEGHKQFMADLFNGLKAAPRCIGDLYWDPIMINCDGVGWAINAETDTADSNVVANTTLFDFNGDALPTLEVFKDTKGADYSVNIGISGDDIAQRFEASEKNGKIHIKNISDNDENIVVLHAEYTDGALSSIKMDKRILKAGQDGSFENGQYTFVWTQEDIRPITMRR